MRNVLDMTVKVATQAGLKAELVRKTEERMSPPANEGRHSFFSAALNPANHSHEAGHIVALTSVGI